MPFFDYKCNKCAELVELMVSFGDMDDMKICPKCNEPTLVKLITCKKLGLHFNGSGFWNTEYRTPK